MAGQVKVEDLEVFTHFRAALIKFAQAATQALTGADAEIASTYFWLEGEQRTYWQNQLRKRTEAATQARDALRQKTLYKDSSGRTPNASVEEKTLAKCLAAVDQAEQKNRAIRKWLPLLQKASDLYRGRVARLSHTVTTDIPRAVALLDRLAATLEEYINIETPAAIPAEPAAPAIPPQPAPATTQLADPGDKTQMPPKITDSNDAPLSAPVQEPPPLNRKENPDSPHDTLPQQNTALSQKESPNVIDG